MLACFFQGLVCFLLASTSRSLQILLRVVEGWMMSSTKPVKYMHYYLAMIHNSSRSEHTCTAVWGKHVEQALWRWMCFVSGNAPLTAAGKGLANFCTYSASASAWFSFPLKMIWTAPLKNDNMYYYIAHLGNIRFHTLINFYDLSSYCEHWINFV